MSAQINLETNTFGNRFKQIIKHLPKKGWKIKNYKVKPNLVEYGYFKAAWYKLDTHIAKSYTIPGIYNGLWLDKYEIIYNP